MTYFAMYLHGFRQKDTAYYVISHLPKNEDTMWHTFCRRNIK